MTLESSRATYSGRELDPSSTASDPIEQLKLWIDEAYASTKIMEPNAMNVATVDESGRPSARIVLMRGLDGRGITFYTSYDSRKGHDLAKNPNIAATFYWGPLHRQVRIEGTVARLSDEESDRYFESRPRGHQLGAWASEQSEPIEDRATMMERLEHFEQRFEGEEVPRPHSWGGYVISPERFEFWQGQENRLHDRVEYLRGARGWQVRRLQP